MPPTPDDLTRFAALAEAALATHIGSRPWQAEEYAGYQGKPLWGLSHGPASDAADRFDVFDDPPEAVCRYAAAAHPLLGLALVAEVQKLRAERDALRRVVTDTAATMTALKPFLAYADAVAAGTLPPEPK